MSADRLSVLRSPAGPAATVAYTGTAGSIQQAIRGNCIMFFCTTQAYVCVGATATITNGTPVPANITFWLPIPDNLGKQGETPTVLISAIQASSGGSLYMQQFD